MVYEGIWMLLIKAKLPVNPTASTIKQTQQNINTVWNSVGISEEEIIECIKVKQVRKGER